MSKKDARKIFEKWRKYMLNADKRISYVSLNFDELFCDMFNAMIPKDVAEKYIPDAVRSHQPTKAIAKYVYRRQDKNAVGSFDEFYNSWLDVIKTKAEASFYDLYPIDDEEEEEKTYGNMSKQEYTKQRKYANSFPQLDVNSLPDHTESLSDEDLGRLLSE